MIKITYITGSHYCGAQVVVEIHNESVKVKNLAKKLLYVDALLLYDKPTT